MPGERWQRMWAAFEQALERPPEERQAFVEAACGDDTVLRRTVMELLAADTDDDALDRPPAEPPRGLTRAPVAATWPESRTGPGAIGPYRLLRPIGQGGMSTVYLAVRDDGLARQVVVKVVQRGRETADIVRRLRTERQILASLDHPYIARLYDGGTTEDRLPYFVMEYIEGVAIDAYCDQNRLPVDARLTLFRKVCAAVQYAHRNLVVHRDLKPSNILVTAAGDPKLLDFGIAKLLNPELTSQAPEPTATWQRLLTPSYASPEQVRGKLITTASDVYSLGVLLYKLLTGRLPHRLADRSPREIERILLEREPTRPSMAAVRESARTGSGAAETPEEIARARGCRPHELARRLAGDLDAIALKALRAVPQERYGSVGRLATDVGRCQRGLPVAARRGSWRYRTGKFFRRHRAATAAAAALVILLAAFAAAMAWQSARVARQRDQARLERDAKESVAALMLEVFRVADPTAKDGAGEVLTVREALARSGPLIEQRLREQPELRAEIQHTIGTIYRNLGLFDHAREQLARALELRRALFGDDHLDIAESLAAAGDVRLLQGDHETALALSREALAVTQRVVGDVSTTLVAPINGLVAVLCATRDYEAADPLARRALELARGLPPEDLERAFALSNMAAVRRGRGEPAAAVELYRQSLALRRAVLGQRHPAVAIALNNLGVTLRQLERLAEAEQALSQSLALQRGLLGEKHPGLVAPLNNLGGLLEAQGKHTQALEHFSAASTILRDTGGLDNQRAFLLELRIQENRIQLGEGEAAAGDLRPALDRWRGPLGEDHRWIARGESLLGQALVTGQDRFAEAEPLLLRSYEKLARQPDGRQQRKALERIVTLYQRWGRPEKADEYRRRLEAGPR